MTTQTEMFPKTELDEANAVLMHLIAEQEKADTAAENAERKACEAAARIAKQRRVIAWLQKQMPAATPAAGEPEIIEDAEVLEIEGDVTDPVTGEVAGRTTTCSACGVVLTTDAAFFDDSKPYCEACWRALPGNQRAGAEDAPEPCVIALYPGDEEPHVTIVGDRTTYGELVADYFTAAGVGEEAESCRWSVVAERELADQSAGYGARLLNAVISPADYGQRLLVVAADQGSVTGVEEDAA